MHINRLLQKEPLSGSWPWCRAARRRRRGKASGRRDHDCGRFIIWNHDFLRITVICVIYKYSIPNLTFHHEDKVARQASNSPRRDSNYTHLRFPGASTKKIIHDVLPSWVYMSIDRSNLKKRIWADGPPRFLRHE